MLALEIIRASGKPAVITLAMHQEGVMREGAPMPRGMRRLEDAGADVVGLNCLARAGDHAAGGSRRSAKPWSCHVAALPVPYRTTPEQPTLPVAPATRPATACPDGRPFPVALDPFTCNRYEIAEFAQPRMPWTCATLASAAARVHTTSAPWRRRSAATRRPAATRLNVAALIFRHRSPAQGGQPGLRYRACSAGHRGRRADGLAGDARARPRRRRFPRGRARRCS